MNINKTRLFILLAFSIAAAFFIFNQLYIDAHFLGGVKLDKNSAEIKSNAAVLAKDLNLSVTNTYFQSELSYNDDIIKHLQNTSGAKKANMLLRDSVPGYFWKLTLLKSGTSSIRVTGPSQKNNKNEKYLTELKIEYDTKGKLLNFSQLIEDTVKLPEISGDEARKIAESFILKYSGIKLLNQNSQKYPNSNSSFLNNQSSYSYTGGKKIEQLSRIDHEFSWASLSGIPGVNRTISISVAGNTIQSFSQEYELLDSDFSFESQQLFKIISKVVFYVLVFVLLAIITYKRIKAYEIGFRMAFILGVVVALSSGIEIYLNLDSEFGWELLIPLILGPLMLAAGIVLIWSASETITREVWKEKFVSIDLATKGYLFHSLTGQSLLKGMSFGLITSAAMLVLLVLLQYFFNTIMVVEEKNFLEHLSSASPALSIFINNIYSSLFLVGVFFLFIVSGLKRRFTSITTLIIICAVIWSIVNVEDIYPIYLGFILQFIYGLILIFIFVKTDVLTTLISLITYYTFNSGFALFTVNNSVYEQSGIFLLVVLILSILISSVALFTKDKITEYDSITPAFAKNISERQRMQRELEIARDVQMSFLPKSIPSFSGLDIASQCIPALEVGGDYFDFVQLSETRLGIIIGDVSGKGTQAAFYMTLTKGFLKALSRSSDSPAVVLAKMNELFYENVERGTFISMIYGIFDRHKKSFTLARAGHNPVIVKNSTDKVEFLNPTGLALGLEKGNIFSKTIEEVVVSFSAGDLFIFYTDGFTEAMNKDKEEFNESRLTALVEKNSKFNASAILQNIIDDVKKFMGKAQQHDDMTMVVVKIE